LTKPSVAVGSGSVALGVLTAGLLGVIGWTAGQHPEIGLALICAVVIGPLLARLGGYRFALVISFAASVLKPDPTGVESSQLVWYLLQFGGIAAAGFLLLFQNRGLRTRTADRRIVAGLLLFVALALASSIWSTRPSDSLAQASMLALVAVFLSLTYLRRWTESTVLRADLAFVYWIVVLTQGVGLAAAGSGAMWALGNYERFQGLTANANYAGMLSAIAIPLGLYLFSSASLRGRVSIACSELVLVLPLLWSGSRGAVLAIVCGVTAMFATRSARAVRLKLAAAFTAAFVITFVVVPWDALTSNELFTRTDKGTGMSSGRTDVWAHVFHDWTRHPLLGTGYRTTQSLDQQSSLEAHNIFLTVLAELGIVGFVCFLTLLVMVFLMRARRGTFALLIGPAVSVLAADMVESSILGFGNPTALLSWLAILAMAAGGRLSASASNVFVPSKDTTPRLAPTSARPPEALR